MSRQLDTS
jgi:hypothetical protein